MQFIKPDINIDFIGKRYFAFAGSLLLIAASIVSLVVKGGPSYGIDFAGFKFSFQRLSLRRTLSEPSPPMSWGSRPFRALEKKKTTST
jgi:preprotein translocase subunit SecF